MLDNTYPVMVIKVNGLTGLEVSLIVLVLLNLIDWITTAYALRKPGYIEANPIARSVYERFGSVGLLAYKQVFVGLIVLSEYLALGGDAEGVLWLYNVIFGLVVAWNSLMLSPYSKTLREYIKKIIRR